MNEYRKAAEIYGITHDPEINLEDVDSKWIMEGVMFSIKNGTDFLDTTADSWAVEVFNFYSDDILMNAAMAILEGSKITKAVSDRIKGSLVDYAKYLISEASDEELMLWGINPF